MNDIIYKNYNLLDEEIEFVENSYPKNNQKKSKENWMKRLKKFIICRLTN